MRPGDVTRVLVLGAVLLAGQAAYAVDEVQEAAVNFYRTYLRLRTFGGLSGIPNERQLARLAQLITPELHGLFTEALREQRRCAAQFPDDKPPWIEGDIFSSSFEGYTSFHVANSKPRAQGRQVAVRFTYVDGRDKVRWSDTLLLSNLEGRWLVDDVRYRATFAFTSGFGTNLQASLKNIPAC